MATPAEPVPPKLGKYLIRRELGRGAMGVVYEGFDPAIERLVAIKTIRPDHLREGGEELLLRFRREAQAAGRLNHPGIVAIYEFGEDGGVAYIAMEFVKGRELKALFDEGHRFPESEIARIMAGILGALDHAHRNGVTHRDIKPANVILLEDGGVKVADFGLARIERSDLTRAGTIMGTPSYMSPEQFLGTGTDPRSDIFSCGVLLYQLLTGELPFTGAATTIMRKVLGEDPMPPSQLNTLLAGSWDAVVKRAIAKKPQDRYATAAGMAADVAAVAAGRAPSAADAEATLLASPEATVLNPASAGGAGRTGGQPAPAKKSALPMIGVAAAVLVAALGGGAYLLASKRSGPAATPATSPAAGALSPAASAPAEPGILTISAIGYADPSKYPGDAGAAGAEARADARRQLIEKALALYVSGDSLDRNYPWIQEKFLPRAAEFIKATLSEEAPQLGKDGLIAAGTRAEVRVRDVQKSLNQMSEQERIGFIRNNGDPKISVQMQVGYADAAQALPPARSQLAENVIKERIKSFGFRTWSLDGETPAAAGARSADFHVVGEVKLKQLSTRLPASGITVTKTALTSWTVKAIDKATGEEIYSSTRLPANAAWATEDAALAEIGKLVGDEFSRNFFLARFNFGSQKIRISVSGLPDAALSASLLRELRSLRGVLDAQPAGKSAFEVELPEGDAGGRVSEGVLKPLNAKLGQACFALGAMSGREASVTFAPACADAAVRGKLDSMPPAGLLSAPPARGRNVLRT